MFAEINSEAFSCLPFVLNTVGESPKQGPINHRDGFSYHEFIWLKSGSGVFRIKGSAYTFTAGDGVFLRRGTPHSYEGQMHTVWMTYAGADGLADFFHVEDYFIFRVPPMLTDAVGELMRLSQGNSSAVSRSAAGYAFATELFERLLIYKETPLNGLRQYMEVHYAEPLTLDNLAEFAGMDRFALCRKYTATYGRTVMEELSLIRIAKAKRFLRFSSDPIERIGRLCGFESASYFGKRFRAVCGLSPGEYRKKHTY